MNKNTTIQLKKDLHRELKLLAIEDGRTVSGLVERILKIYLDKNKKPLPNDRGLILPVTKKQDD
jgi:hypothetical protein